MTDHLGAAFDVDLAAFTELSSLARKLSRFRQTYCSSQRSVQGEALPPVERIVEHVTDVQCSAYSHQRHQP